MIPYYKNLQVRSSAGRHSDVINMLSNVMRCNYNGLGRKKLHRLKESALNRVKRLRAVCGSPELENCVDNGYNSQSKWLFGTAFLQR